MTDIGEKIFNLILALPAIVIAFTLHELAHAWVADRLGDDTPRRMGRITLDPVAHLDPFGSIMFVVTQLSGYGIGWAKPVMTMPRNFQNPRRDSMLVAIAGPISNLLQAAVWFIALWIFRVVTGPALFASLGEPLSPLNIIFTVLAGGVTINILLAAFNMIPLPPLDGHYVLEYLGPPAITQFFDQIRPMSFLLILILSSTGLLRMFIAPFLEFGNRLVLFAMGVL
jgi:Zn-dependent protease